MPKTKTPKFKEASAEQIEKWATRAVADFQEDQQLALVSLLSEIARCAGNHGDVESMALTARHAAFLAADGLHDTAIEAVVSAGGVQ